MSHTVAEVIDRARELVDLTRQVLDGRETLPALGDDDLEAADEALSATRRALSSTSNSPCSHHRKAVTAKSPRCCCDRNWCKCR